MRHDPVPLTRALCADVDRAIRTGWSPSRRAASSFGRGSAEAHAATPIVAMKRLLRMCIPHCVIQSVKGFCDLRVTVRGGHETRLECRWCEIHTTVESGVEESSEHFNVTLLRCAEVPNRTSVKKESPHRSRTAGRKRNTEPCSNTHQAADEVRGPPRDSVVQLRSQRRDGRIPCSHRKGIARQRPRLINRARGSDPLHYVPFSAICGCGKSSPDDLAESGDVSRDARHLASSSSGDAEPCHHFIEDEQRTRFVSDITQTLKKARLGRDESRVADDRLYDDRRESAFRAMRDGTRRFEIVERRGKRQRGESGRHSG